jgi:hypothetical protein
MRQNNPFGAVRLDQLAELVAPEQEMPLAESCNSWCGDGPESAAQR